MVMELFYEIANQPLIIIISLAIGILIALDLTKGRHTTDGIFFLIVVVFSTLAMLFLAFILANLFYILAILLIIILLIMLWKSS